MSHTQRSRNKLRRKYPLLRWPFAYTEGTVRYFCTAAAHTQQPALPCAVRSTVTAYCPNFEVFGTPEVFGMRCAKSVWRRRLWLAMLCSCPPLAPGWGRTCPGRGGKGQRPLSFLGGGPPLGRREHIPLRARETQPQEHRGAALPRRALPLTGAVARGRQRHPPVT